MEPVVVVLIAVGVIGFAIVAYRQEMKRRKLIRAWMRRRRFTRQQDRKDWHKLYPGLKLFGKGHSRGGGRVFGGEFKGRPVTLFDYKYVTGSGKNRQTHKHGVVILHFDFPTIPMQIRREHAFDKIGEFVGLDDIDFESVEFSKKFYVKSSDRKWAYDVIHTRTMEYLLQAPSFNIEFGLVEVLIHKRGWFDPAGFEAALDMAWRLYELIPEYVVESMKGSK